VGRRVGILAAAPRVVEPEEILEDARARPAVQERVVISPDEVEVVVSQSEDGKAHEGKSGEVESATAVFVEEALKRASRSSEKSLDQSSSVHSGGASGSTS
jgi:hypothetical protein